MPTDFDMYADIYRSFHAQAVAREVESKLVRAVYQRDAAIAEAQRWFEAVIAVNPMHSPLTHPRHWFLRSVARLFDSYGKAPTSMLAAQALQVGKWELAVRYYRDALDLDPDNPEIWSHIGDALKSAGRATEAELAYRISRERTA
jgi:tetratricopeptide (TPR) repeat protein